MLRVTHSTQSNSTAEKMYKEMPISLLSTLRSVHFIVVLTSPSTDYLPRWSMRSRLNGCLQVSFDTTTYMNIDTQIAMKVIS